MQQQVQLDNVERQLGGHFVLVIVDGCSCGSVGICLEWCWCWGNICLQGIKLRLSWATEARAQMRKDIVFFHQSHPVALCFYDNKTVYAAGRQDSDLEIGFLSNYLRKRRLISSSNGVFYQFRLGATLKNG